MSSMKASVPLCLLAMMALMLVATGCGRPPTLPLSKANLELRIHSDTTVYLSTDTFGGTLTFTNKTERKIRETLPSGVLYHVDIYDDSGRQRRSFLPTPRDSSGLCFELEPLATRTDTLRLPLYPVHADSILFDGKYLVVARIEGHPDIESETAVYVES
jgi:hypothetical protein